MGGCQRSKGAFSGFGGRASKNKLCCAKGSRVAAAKGISITAIRGAAKRLEQFQGCNSPNKILVSHAEGNILSAPRHCLSP